MNGPDGKRFVWGIIEATHRIGPYEFVQGRWGQGSQRGEAAFFIYVDGKDVGLSTHTLDEALASAIAYRREGLGSQAARYFMKMLAPESK